MSEFTPLKHYFGVELAERLASLIVPHDASFPANDFVEAVAEQVGPLELKERVAVISRELRHSLPADYIVSLDILLQLLGPENETEEGMFTNGYFLMPVAHFVEVYGLDHFDVSMRALYEITKRHTSEYAIRPYLARYPDESLALLTTWTKDANPHVRRLVSEGTRPRLPWAKRMDPLYGDPRRNLALLEPLWNDSSFYVRKSVANHLNDLTKVDKDATLDWLLDQWDRGGEHTPWIVRQSLRSLIKSGDAEAMRIATYGRSIGRKRK